MEEWTTIYGIEWNFEDGSISITSRRAWTSLIMKRHGISTGNSSQAVNLCFCSVFLLCRNNLHARLMLLCLNTYTIFCYRPNSVPTRYQAATPEPTPPRSYTPVPRSPHWINHEGNTASQRVRSQMLARGVPYVNHGMNPPWKERPAEEERDGFTKLIPQSEIARTQTIALQRATQHAHDSKHLVAARTLQMTEGSGLFKT